jgi:hypothetical protein
MVVAEYTRNPQVIDTETTNHAPKLKAGLADAPHTLSALAPDTGVADEIRRTVPWRPAALPPRAAGLAPS